MVRIKRRYILAELILAQALQNIDKKSLLDAIKDAISDFYGDLGYAKVSSNF